MIIKDSQSVDSMVSVVSADTFVPAGIHCPFCREPSGYLKEIQGVSKRYKASQRDARHLLHILATAARVNTSAALRV
jgi:hypothetical protein